jgi:hypothetical protein
MMLNICIDYHCDFRQDIQMSEEHFQRLEQLFETGSSAAEERHTIAQAIALMEQIAGEQSETWRDLEQNRGEGSQKGQLDCISESTNTTTYLQMLEKHRLMRWHRLMPRERRNPWLVDFHWTAVIQETTGNRSFAVDSWFLKNGEPPLIQPIEAWLSGKDPEFDEQ